MVFRTCPEPDVLAGREVRQCEAKTLRPPLPTLPIAQPVSRFALGDRHTPGLGHLRNSPLRQRNFVHCFDVEKRY